MKKLFTLLIMLFACISINATNYNIWVAGVRVTDANKDKITGDGITGTVRYNPSSQKLFLDNATIKATGDNYGILIEGSCGAIAMDENSSIEASGSKPAIGLSVKYFEICAQMNVESTNNIKYTGKANQPAILAAGTLIFSSNTYNVSSTGDYAILNENKNGLIGWQTMVQFTASAATAAIYGFKSITLSGNGFANSIETPVFGKYDTDKANIVDPNGNVAKQIVVKPGSHEDYSIKVGGVYVTKDNASDILGDGNVYYDASNNALCFKDGAAVTAQSGDYAIHAAQDLKIWLRGVATITQKNSGFSAVRLNGGHKYSIVSTVSATNPLLEIVTNGQPGIYVDPNGSLGCSYCSVNISGVSSTMGIRGIDGATLSLNGVDMTINGAGKCLPIAGFNSVSLSNVQVTNPAGATYNTSAKCFKNGTSSVYGNLEISADKYDIYVAGTQVTAKNRNNINGSSKIQYVPSTKTLTLNGVTIKTTGTTEGILAKDDLTINLKGSNNISTANAASVKGTADKIIKIVSDGSGSLTANSTSNLALYTANGTLTLEKCKVYATGKSYGIASDRKGTLNIKDAVVTAEGAKGSIVLFGDINCAGVDIVTPTNAIWAYIGGTYNSKGAMDEQSGSAITEKVTIDVLGYGVFVGGTEVTTANVDNVYNGNVTFDSSSYTLTLNNANIACEGYGISINPLNRKGKTNKDLTIKLIGTNSITSQKSDGIYLQRPTTITSSADGKLTVNSMSGNGVYHSDKLSMENCSLDVTGYGYGFTTLGYSKNYSININNANVKAKGGKGAFYGYTTENLTNSYVATESVQFDGSQESRSGYIVSNTVKLCKEIEIKAGSDPTIVAPTISNKTITIAGVTNSSISLSWKAAKDNTTAASKLKYQINYTKSGTSKGNTVNVTGQTKTEIKNLEANTTYNIKMNVFDEDGNYASYTSTTATTAADPTNYGVIVGDIAVTSLNSSDVLGDGKVKYDVETNVLTLDNAVITPTDKKIGIYSDDPLTINLIGTSKITVTGESGIQSKATIQSASGTDGKLVISADVDGIVSSGNLLIQNCNVSIICKTDGLWGGNKTTGILTIDNANVDITANRAIYQFASFTLNNGYIETPANSKFNDNCIENADGNVATNVVIKAGSDPTTIAPTISKKTITIAGVTSSSISLSWTAAKDNTTAESKLVYKITYTKSGASSGKTVKVTGKTSAEITGLEENTTYKIAIKVVDADGNTAGYTSTTATTAVAPDETKPTLPADNSITLKKKGKTTLTISWNAATDDKTAAADLQYEISVFIDGEWKVVATVKDVTEYKITGLKSSTEYKISVAVIDEAGNRETYKELTVSTTVGIDAILADDPDVKMYNISGLPVDKGYKGIVIINGQKYIKK